MSYKKFFVGFAAGIAIAFIATQRTKFLNQKQDSLSTEDLIQQEKNHLAAHMQKVEYIRAEENLINTSKPFQHNPKIPAHLQDVIYRRNPNPENQ